MKEIMMTEQEFNQESHIKQITHNFTENGWVTIYYHESVSYLTHYGVFCCLITKGEKEKYLSTYQWPIHPGSEGRFAVYGDNTYQSFPEKDLEPFIFYRTFNHDAGLAKYIDISEEFILYFNLYEKIITKLDRRYYFIDDLGNWDEVIEVQPDQIRVKLKYLKEYITIRDMMFMVCFDFMIIQKQVPTGWQCPNKNETCKKDNYIYNHLIGPSVNGYQSWLMGKVLIQGNTVKKTHFNSPEEFESYITGYDSEGNLRIESCSPDNDDSFLRPVYFSRDVLDKYFNDPKQYEVGFNSITSRYFTLKADVNNEDYVAVFLGDLADLPIKEQLYWKSFNIPPQSGMGLSGTYYQTMILGQWGAQPDALDQYFRMKYEEVNQTWMTKLGWKLFQDFEDVNKELLLSLHTLNSDNPKVFKEQVLILTKLLIDGLNEKELAKHVTPEKNDKGIRKFEKYLASKEIVIEEMFVFLRKMQSIRSTSSAHLVSSSKSMSALEYFNYSEGNFKSTFIEILGRAVLTVNTIEKIANQISSQQKVQSDDRHIDLSEFSTETILAKE